MSANAAKIEFKVDDPAQGVDIGIVSDDEPVVARCEAICRDFGFTYYTWNSLDSFMESSAKLKMVIACLVDFKTASAAAELAQGARFATSDAFLICAVPGMVGKDAAAAAKKSGADLILLRDEIIETCKVEFCALQRINASYLPIKSSDLTPNIPVPFDLYHLLPQRGKFIRFIVKGTVLSPEKVTKLHSVGEVYIKRDSADDFKAYVTANPDLSAKGLARRCRSQYLALHASYLDLILLLTDQSETSSLAIGQKLLKQCQTMCAELLGALGEFGDAWDVINNSAIGELGTVDRGPAIAAYSGLFGLQMDVDAINDVMLAGLLSDLGLLLMTPEIGKKLREDRERDLTPEEMILYRSYPELSLNLLLGRKLSLEESFRKLFLSTQERADGKGFPKGINEERLSMGAQIVQFSRDLDRRTWLRLGQARPKRDQILKKMVDEDASKHQRFSAKFWELMKQTLPN